MVMARVADEDTYVCEVPDENQAALARHMRMASRVVFLRGTCPNPWSLFQ